MDSTRVPARSWAAAIACAAVCLAILAPARALGAPEGTSPSSAEERRTMEPPPAARSVAAPSDPRYDVVFGLIVRKVSTGVSARSLAATMESAGAEVTETTSLTPDVSVLTFAEPTTFAEAAVIEAAVEARPDVIAAEPDRIVFPAVEPEFPNDPRFDEQWDMWDGGGSDDFGVRGPLIWGTTKGSPSVVVGVIDTGGTNHPDLAGTTVPGFDFISDAPTARDGNEWDSNPDDEGDWCPSEGEDSSWHGTHVHGTINAVQDNGVGITGLAPAVKVQHLRALGACGGSGSDILAAVIWGSGGDLSEFFAPYPGKDPGMNPTPAEVLNMSLGGEGECDAEVSQVIFDAARARGTTVVVAAGNESSPAGGFWPGNCRRVVNVAATNRTGDLAGFSNFGTSAGQVTLAAPGVGILSTMNQGTTIPAGSSYVNYSGTSMAAPHVAAAAALLYSLGVTTPSTVVTALKAAVRPFPAGSSCNATKCGAGILDASKLNGDVPAEDPGAPTSIVAVAGNASATVSWTAPAQTGGSAIASYTAVASPGGQSCTTAGTTCTITGLTNGTTYTASVTATNGAGRTGPPGTSAPFTPLEATGSVPGAPTGVYATPLSSTEIRVQWTPPANTGGSGIVAYLVQYQIDDGGWNDFDSPIEGTSMTATGASPGYYYSFRVAAVNTIGQGAWSEPSAPVSSENVERRPGRVRGVTVDYSGSRNVTATIRWRLPLDLGTEPVDRYRVRLKLNGGSYGKWFGVTRRVVVAENLRAGRGYTVQIQAHNAVGWGTSKSVALRP